MLVLELDTVGTVGVVLALSAGASYGMTQIVKSLWQGWLARRKAAEPWFYNATLRTVACVAGAVLGFYNLGAPLGVGLGFAAGALNTFIVHKVKKYLAAKVGQ